MNKTDDSQTPDATRFINQRKIILKALFKLKKKTLLWKKTSPNTPGNNSLLFRW